MNYGIVIIALGYPLYGNAAFNLALSIKNTTKDVPIAIVHDNQSISMLTEREHSFFDHYVTLPEKYYTIGDSKQYQRSKLCLDLIAKTLGWERVIYMDADNLWLDKPVSWLFGELANKDFFIGYNGEYNVNTKQRTNKNYTYWALDGNEKRVCEYHGIKSFLPQTISGFVYFKAGPKADSIFKKAREVYDDPNAPTITWAGGKPDEYCMNISLALHDYKQEQAHIFYFQNVNGGLSDDNIQKKFWGFATGGNVVNPKIVHLFNRKVNLLCIQNDISTRHYHVDKKDVILERAKY